MAKKTNKSDTVAAAPSAPLVAPVVQIKLSYFRPGGGPIVASSVIEFPRRKADAMNELFVHVRKLQCAGQLPGLPVTPNGEPHDFVTFIDSADHPEGKHQIVMPQLN